MIKNYLFISLASVLALCIVCQAQEYFSPYPHPCDRPCPYNYAPVCTNIGVTYPNLCAFQVANCKRPPWAKLWIIFYRECPFYYKD